MPATNVLSLFAKRAMSMKDEREIKSVLSAKLDTNELKVIVSCAININLIKLQLPCKLLFKFGNTAGCPRVAGDDEEDDDIDDLDHEFDLGKNDALDSSKLSAAMLFARRNNGYGSQASSSGLSTCSEHDFSQLPEIPLLTYNEEVNSIIYMV